PSARATSAFVDRLVAHSRQSPARAIVVRSFASDDAGTLGSIRMRSVNLTILCLSIASCTAAKPPFEDAGPHDGGMDAAPDGGLDAAGDGGMDARVDGGMDAGTDGG